MSQIIPRIQDRVRGKKLAKFGVAFVAVLALGIAPALVSATAANAAEIDAITSVTIDDPPTAVGDIFEITATWVAPPGAQAGDTFTLEVPPVVTPFASSFTMFDSEGLAVGECDVTETGFTCTLTDYITTHANVKGTIYFRAQVTEVVTEGELLFETENGVDFVVPLPDGGIGDGEPGVAPTDPVKWGWVETDGESIMWKIFVPSEDLATPDGTPVVLTDTYDEQLTFDAGTLHAGWIDKDQWDAGTWTEFGEGAGADTYTLTENPAMNSFDITFNQPNTDGTRIYGFWYTTPVPEGADVGEVYENTVTASGLDTFGTQIEIVKAGGEGSGDLLGGFTVLKQVTGEGAELVPATTEFTIPYSYEDAGTTVEGTLTVVNGGSAGLENLAPGTVVTLSEAAPTPVEGMTFGTPHFTGEGVTGVDGGATVLIDQGAVVNVVLENPTSLVLIEEPEPEPSPSPVPETSPVPPAESAPPLAQTGVEVGPMTAGAVLLLALGLGLVLARRNASAVVVKKQ